MYATSSKNTTVGLLDMSGRVIRQVQAKSAVGMNNIQLSLGEIASGVYTGTGVRTQPFDAQAK
ncbi:MAG: hypothetical protein IPI22_11225 [Bacteroidetes bacterium]|nr:hypothetical protein [Bacteroidota bacterium]